MNCKFANFLFLWKRIKARNKQNNPEKDKNKRKSSSNTGKNDSHDVSDADDEFASLFSTANLDPSEHPEFMQGNSGKAKRDEVPVTDDMPLTRMVVPAGLVVEGKSLARAAVEEYPYTVLGNVYERKKMSKRGKWLMFR